MRQNELCEKLLSSVLTAHDQKAENQLAGTIGTLQLALNKISTPEISYVLSADEFSLDINNPTAPTFLSLANTPTLMDTFGPVLSLIATVSLKMMNQENKQHSIVILDEAPTIYIPKLETVPATGRSRKIAVVFMCQDFSQITDKYGQTKKETIVSNLANQFYGRVSNLQTAEYVSKIFGRKDTLMKSRSFNEGTGDSNSGASKSGRSSSTNQGESISYSYQEREVLKPQVVFGFTQGRFASMIAERPEHLPALFIGDYEKFEVPVSLDELPEIRPELDVITLHRQINADIKAMLAEQPKAEIPQSPQTAIPKPTEKPKFIPITGKEHTCATSDFKTVLQSIALTQTAITEMQVRYIFDNNTIPISTYDFIPKKKQTGENWAGYCTRTINEATINFNTLISSGDIEKNAIKKYQVLQEKQNTGIIISEHLRFILFLDRTGSPSPN
jgi:hypothetical protein